MAHTKLTDDDLRALWAYLKVQPPVKQTNRKHDLKWFTRARSLVGSWKSLYFTPGAYVPDAKKSAAWNRRAYLVNAPGHCAECHSPRNLLGGIVLGASVGRQSARDACCRPRRQRAEPAS